MATTPTLTARGKELEALIDNPNVQVMLELISRLEGTTKHGYYTNFGGARAETLGPHPRKHVAFTQTDGKKNMSSAFGRYQFMPKTWDEEVVKLGIKDDMSERNQDLAALSRLKMRGALNDVLAGDFEAAVNKIGNEWVSAPSAPAKHKQRKRNWDFVRNNLADISSRQGVALSPSQQTQFDTESQQRLQDSATPKSWHDIIKNIFSESGLPQAGSQSVLGEAPVEEQDPLSQLATSLPQGRSQYGSYLDPLMNLEPWENSFMSASIERDADLARNSAVANLLGLPNVPDGALPKPIDKAIGSIIATL